jgi:DNA-binding NtrC family response regulator
MDTVISTIKEVSRKPFVMVVDDDQNLCDLLHERFRENGFNVVTRPSGLAGVQMVQRKVPDVVFLDMMMDDMDGLATLQRMKELLGDRCPKIIMMSAYDVGSKFKTARELGVLECLQKPLNIARMKDMICGALKEEAKPRICIIDNDRAACDTLTKALTDNGYEVDLAHNADEVMQKLRHEAFSVAVVNVEAADLNNLQTYEKIQELNPETGVIIISSAAIDEKTFVALNRNNYSVLQKPFDADHVLRMVENIRNSKNKKSAQ